MLGEITRALRSAVKLSSNNRKGDQINLGNRTDEKRSWVLGVRYIIPLPFGLLMKLRVKNINEKVVGRSPEADGLGGGGAVRSARHALLAKPATRPDSPAVEGRGRDQVR